MRTVSQVVFAVLAIASLVSGVSGGPALLAGFAIALTLGNPWLPETRRWTPLLLQFSVVGLGAAVNLATVAAVGLQGVAYTAIGIFAAMGLGWLLGRMVGTDRVTSLLISIGTAICGGSAIAAVAPVVRAKDHEVSISLATVFLLNAAALFIFPAIGHRFGLSEEQFGLWSALAIHDTSSVVGASLQYGPKALEIATTVKLARALWIVPMTLAIGFVWARVSGEAGQGKSKKPWFILGFLLMSALVTAFPVLQPPGRVLADLAKRALVLTLFLIGSGLTRDTLRNVGVRPFLQGLVLWIIVGGGTLYLIVIGQIR